MNKEMFDIVLEMYDNYKENLISTIKSEKKIHVFTDQYKNIFTSGQLDKLCELEQEIIDICNEWD